MLAGADGQELGCSQRETGQDEELSFTNPSGRPRVLYVEVYGFDGSWSAAKPYLLEARW